jgi:hypothetical protein
MDCLEAVSMIKAEGEDRSVVTYTLREIKGLLQGGIEYKLEHIRREQNLVSHALANLDRAETVSDVWLGSGPPNILVLCNEDCKFVTLVLD